MNLTEAPWTPVCEQVADVVDRHEPHPDGDGCTCGWSGDSGYAYGQYTFGEHIAQVLANLRLLATTNPEETP